MSKIINSLYNLRLIDEMSKKETTIHRIHPVVKLLTTIVYLTIVISFGKYEISSILPLIFYPVIIFSFAEIPVAPILKRVLLVEPFIIGIGVLGVIFDDYKVLILGISISSGWISFLSIFIKCGLTVTASILLVATTGIDELASALRKIKVPKIFVLQILLTYRYITILMEEVLRMLRAYSLRAPGQKGIQRKSWGSFAGQLILRTYDRAQRVYEAMSLRGFTGEYNTGNIEKITVKDITYLALWSLFFIIARCINIPMFIEILLSGVIR